MEMELAYIVPSCRSLPFFRQKFRQCWLFVSAGVAVGRFEGFSLICVINVKNNWASSAPNRASRGVL